MSESDSSYKIQIIFDLLNQGKVEEAKGALQQLGEQMTGSASAVENLGAKTEEAGEHASHAAQKHQALSAIVSELGRLSPGLGQALQLLSDAYIEAGASAEGGAVGMTAFNAALSELLVTMGPFIIAMLAIEAAATYWDMFKEKSKAAADAATESLKRIDGSLRETMKLQQDLNDALLGKDDPLKRIHEAARRDEDQIRARFEGDRENNRIKEQNELKTAASPEQKEAIRQKYEKLDDISKQSEEDALIGSKKTELDSVDKEIKTATEEVDKINRQIVDLGVNGDPAERERLNGEKKKQVDLVARLQGEQSDAIYDIQDAQGVSDIHARNRVVETASRAQGDGSVESGVQAYASWMAGDHSQKNADAIKVLNDTYKTIAGNTDLMLSAMKFAHDHALTQKQEIDVMKHQLQYLAKGPQ